MCGGTHGSPWDILPTFCIEQWDRIDIEFTCAVVQMGVPGIFYLCPA